MRAHDTLGITFNTQITYSNGMFRDYRHEIENYYTILPKFFIKYHKFVEKIAMLNEIMGYSEIKYDEEINKIRKEFDEFRVLFRKIKKPSKNLFKQSRPTYCVLTKKYPKKMKKHKYINFYPLK